MKLSVLIKTYNEAAKIAGCLTALFDALAGWGGEAEVIVADSRSTDATVEIAALFPVTVVRLSPQEPRGCGIGTQMAYQHSNGDFVLLLDGDMELQPGFLEAGFRALDADPRLGGVAGIVQETTILNRFDRHRVITRADTRCGLQPLLNGGGLYRRTAIEDAGGYAADRNLDAFEETELGLRLGFRGWRLMRLPAPFVKHSGHAMSTWRLTRQMWRSGRMAAGGVLLRIALCRPWFPSVLWMVGHSLGVMLFWPVLAAVVLLGQPRVAMALSVGAAAVFVLLAYRKRNLVNAMFSVAMWHLAAAAMLHGFTRRLTPPTQAIDTEVVALPRQPGDVRLPACAATPS